MSPLGICMTLGGLAALALLAWDPEFQKGDAVQGVIVANLMQVTELRNPEEQVRVRLPNDLIVNAIVSPSGGHPYALGTSVVVIPYRSLLFSKQTYRAYARGQVGP
jgi:hypothetical protein